MAAHGRFFGPLPTTGPWSAVGMSRGHFFLVLALSVAAFVLVDGPVWRHVHDSHLLRIVVSYALIPVGVLWAFGRTWSRRMGHVLAATALISLVKLVLTAGMLAMIEMAR